MTPDAPPASGSSVGTAADSGVVVTGTGRAGAAPDVIRLSLAAEHRSSSVQDALDTAVAALERMRHVLHESGVAAGDVVTTTTSVWSETGQQGRVVAHTARLGLDAKVRDVGSAGEVLAAVLAAAGDAARLDGVAPEHADTAALERAAREAAFADAKGRAEQYARLATGRLGPVQSVVEGGVRPLGAVPGSMRMFRAADVSSVPVDPGALEVTASVTVHWAWG